MDAEDVYWFSDVRGPLTSLFGSRSAQGGRALRQLANFSGPETSFCPFNRATDLSKLGFVHIVVHPQYRLVKGTEKGEKCELVDVSMSWWLSKPVQEYLDYQIRQNKLALDKVGEVLEKDASVSTPSSCPGIAASQ